MSFHKSYGTGATNLNTRLVVHEAEVDVFFWNSLAFSMIQRMLEILISGSSVFTKSSLNFWNFLVHVLLKTSFEDFEHYLLPCGMSAVVR